MWEIIISSIQVMLKNKVRSLLTMLGVIIGILSLIVIVVIGNAFSETLTKVSDILFENDQLYVEIVPTDNNKTVIYDENGNAVVPEGVFLDKRNVNKILEESDEDVSIVIGGFLDGICTGSSSLGRSNRFMVNGCCADFLETTASKLNKGRGISSADEKNKASVAIIADISAEYLFDNEDPIGKELNINYNNTIIPVVVIGTFKYTGYSYDNPSQISSIMYVNHTYIEDKFSEILNDKYWISTFLALSAKDIDNMNEFKESFASKCNNYLKNDNWTVKVTSQSEEIKAIEELVGIILKIVFIIASIALFIGGIGIMNVMLITVTERTNEIGTRKAIGADNSYIIFQFLFESFIIAFTGTVIGVVSGLLISKFIAQFASIYLSEQLNISFTIGVSLPVKMLIISILTSILIGVVFGLYPAIKAVRMQIVDALRYE